MAKKRRAGSEVSSDGDPLGKPLEVYNAKGKAIAYLIVGVVMGLLGGGGLAYGLPKGEDGLMATLIGGLFALGAPVFVGVSLYNLKRSFEVRRGGVRFTSWGKTTEMRWDEVKRIDVTRTVDDDVPGARGRTVQWEVHIQGRKKEIVLGPTFLELVRSPSALVKLLKMRCGQDDDDVPLF
jgi:hypothetical protein